MEAIWDIIEGLSLVNSTNQRLPSSQLDSMEYEMQRQQENVAQSAKEKGKKPSHRIPAMILLFTHYQSLEAQCSMRSTPNLFHQTLISNEYPPSQRSFDELRAITLHDLLVEIVHEDTYIVLR